MSVGREIGPTFAMRQQPEGWWLWCSVCIRRVEHVVVENHLAEQPDAYGPEFVFTGIRTFTFTCHEESATFWLDVQTGFVERVL